MSDKPVIHPCVGVIDLKEGRWPEPGPRARLTLGLAFIIIGAIGVLGPRIGFELGRNSLGDIGALLLFNVLFFSGMLLFFNRKE